MRILNAKQMREADRATIDDVGLPSIVLMENAGRQVVAALESLYDDLNDQRVAIIAGKGSNGGDGFVVARTLHQRGVDATVFLVGRVAEVKGDARINLDILGRLSVTVVEVADEGSWELHFSEVSQHDLIIDALFGTGLTTALKGLHQTVVADLNASGLPIVSIDLPSGLDCDTGEPLGVAVKAHHTITFVGMKEGFLTASARQYVGELHFVDIGAPRRLVEEYLKP